MWKEDLIRQAKELDMCAENYRALASCETKRQAIGLYKKTIDWAIERKYPALSKIAEHFSGQEDAGVFVNKVFHGEKLCTEQVYVFHNCRGTVYVEMDYDNAVIPMLYFANGCRMFVKCRQNNSPAIRVPIYRTAEDVVVGISGKDTALFTFKTIGLL